MIQVRINKKAFSVASLHEASDETAFWIKKTPEERFEAVEWMRQINYGYDPVTTRLQRVLEVVERT